MLMLDSRVLSIPELLGRVSSHYANIYGSRGAIAPGALSNTRLYAAQPSAHSVGSTVRAI
jgi:hypothetical protein